MQRLILVGGGHAHVVALSVMAGRVPRGLEIVLVNPSSHHLYSGMLPGFLVGNYTASQCRIDLQALLQAAGAELVRASVTAIDADARCVRLDNGCTLPYDWLSLDMGSETPQAGLEPLGPRVFSVKPVAAFFDLWPTALAQAQQATSFSLSVVGAGAAGVEIAFAAAHSLRRVCPNVRVQLLSSESGLLPGHAPSAQDRIAILLKTHNIDLLTFSRDAAALRADFVLLATGAKAPALLRESKLGLDEAGYVLVDSTHRSRSHDNVFAAGDVCSRDDVPMARSGVHAVRSGAVLGANLIAVANGAPCKTYQPKAASLYLLAYAPRRAMASWGRLSVSGWLMWQLKDWIDRRFVEGHSRFVMRRAQTNGWLTR